MLTGTTGLDRFSKNWHGSMFHDCSVEVKCTVHDSDPKVPFTRRVMAETTQNGYACWRRASLHMLPGTTGLDWYSNNCLRSTLQICSVEVKCTVHDSDPKVPFTRRVMAETTLRSSQVN